MSGATELRYPRTGPAERPHEGTGRSPRKEDNGPGAAGSLVRPGLVAVGVAFALVGAAVIVGILYPGDIPTVERSSSDKVANLTGSDWRSLAVPATASSPATLTFNWSASAPVNVTWYSAYPCTPAPHTCVTSPPLWTWIENVSGHWGATGTAGALYEFEVEAAGGPNASVNFSATFTEEYRAGQRTLPPLPFAVTMVGGSLLAGVGAVALYLGLFLPAEVYAPPEPEPPPDVGPVPREDAPAPTGPERPG